MLISCNKLKQYIKNAEEIDWLKVWDKFTIRTAEIEDVKEVGNTFDNVVVAEVLTCEEHPDSDHLHILTVDIGEDEPIQVVCGAPNVRVGLKTAYVKVGGHIDGFEIKQKPLRGVMSSGMCCSGKELSISDNHDGVLELPSEYKNGEDICSYLPIKDIIVEIDNKSLTNRPDLWGHYGIAREISAITNHELLSLDLEQIVNDKEDLNIDIKNPELCYRYSGLKVGNIKNNKTPLDMQIFLYYCGMRSISLLVDVTNYILLEMGQPMHAFDSNIVKSIEVGLASDGDKFKTLDGEERILTKDNLMIKNKDTYFAIAGVMGGEDSEILDTTDSTFLESACFNAGSVRKTAVSLGLRTEASARYEKSLDPNMTVDAIKRAVYLIRQSNPYLVIESNLTDVYPTKVEEGNITLEKNLLTKYMGKKIDDDFVKNTLESLGFKVKVNDDNYDVVVPTFRNTKDISIPEDLIEEVSRMYGFENLNCVALAPVVESHPKETIYNEEYKMKYLLASKYDMHEVHSYLWYDSKTLKDICVDKDGVKLLGKSENNVLRDDLGFSLLNIVSTNFKNLNNFKIFEIGTVIKNKDNKRVLSILIGDRENKLEDNYNYAKNIVKYIFKSLKNIDVSIDSHASNFDYYDSSLGKGIIYNDDVIGTINVLNNNILSKISKKKSLVVIDIDFDKYVNINKNELLAENISKYPTVELDYTIILGNDKKYIDLENVLKGFNSNLIKEYYLNDIYENKYNIKYILGSNNKTLESKDLLNFKERFIKYIKESGLDIIE